MIELRLIPVGRIMAVLAFFAVFAFMNIVIFVAGKTGFFRLVFVNVFVACVTVIAVYAFVATKQTEFGLLVMIESGFVPVFRDMTGITLFTIT